MPSPFPGMDPFLESPNTFRDLHNTFITYLRVDIQKQLPLRYVARVGERTWVETRDSHIEPDVLIRETPVTAPHEATAPVSTAVAAPVIVSIADEEWVEPYLDILLVEGQRLVTAIEVLSPTNKRPGERGQALYLQKQAEVMNRSANLVEIDLLRGGRHTTAVPEQTLRAIDSEACYHVCARDFAKPRQLEVYPIRLRSPLPVVRIPLLPGDSAPTVDLQVVFNRAWDDAAFGRSIDYGAELPPPPLAEDDLSWLRDQVKQSSLV